jgi:D-3-phosphoglycerate dehydrogenase / 2-oxoglutarate reductase
MTTKPYHHIAFLSPMATETLAVLKNLVPNGFEITFSQSNDRAEHLRMLETAEYIFVGASTIDADLIHSAPHLKMIQKWGIGVERIDLEAARKQGIMVAITNGANSLPVAEHTIMLMLACLRRLPLAHNSLVQGQWIAPKLRTICNQLEGKTVGLFGFGNIAQGVAKRLAGFDVRILYHSRHPVDAQIERDLKVTRVDLETLLTQSDILSLHATLNASNKNVIDASALQKMKSSAIVINTARGALVDELALVDALQSGRLRGAGLDTFCIEPLQKDHPLLHLDQVVLTPHSGASVNEVVAKIGTHAMNNMQRFEQGLPLDPADIIVKP